MEGFYSDAELREIGFKAVGKDVLISKKASLYGVSKMSFGDNVRIDDFCILVGNITFKSNIHIGAFSGFHASQGSITMGNYSTLSSNVAVYAASDDYSGDYMTSSVVAEEYKNTISSDIIIGDYVIVGTGSSILPGSVIPDGVAVGAMSLVKTELQEWSIYAGVPCKKIRNRSKKLLDICDKFLTEDLKQMSEFTRNVENQSTSPKRGGGGVYYPKKINNVLLVIIPVFISFYSAFQQSFKNTEGLFVKAQNGYKCERDIL